MKNYEQFKILELLNKIDVQSSSSEMDVDDIIALWSDIKNKQEEQEIFSKIAINACNLRTLSKKLDMLLSKMCNDCFKGE